MPTAWERVSGDIYYTIHELCGAPLAVTTNRSGRRTGKREVVSKRAGLRKHFGRHGLRDIGSTKFFLGGIARKFGLISNCLEPQSTGLRAKGPMSGRRAERIGDLGRRSAVPFE